MLHLETVTPALLKIISAVSGEPMFQDFRLVGGTALSLQLGHRTSVDAALKLDAVINRKEEKDFRDIHALLSVYSLAELLTFYRERILHRELRLVIDHLAAAPAADRQASIELFKPVEYESVANDIILAIQNHLAFLKAEQTRLAEERLRQRLNPLKKEDNPPE